MNQILCSWNESIENRTLWTTNLVAVAEWTLDHNQFVIYVREFVGGGIGVRNFKYAGREMKGGWWAARFVRCKFLFLFFCWEGAVDGHLKEKEGGFFFLYRACGCFFLFGGVRGWFFLRGKSGRLFFLCSRWALGVFFVCFLFLVYRVVFFKKKMGTGWFFL